MKAKKLLVADDSLTIQKVIRLALSNEGYEIQAVSDGNDAVQQISLFRPDVVLIDVSLPGKTAFEVKRAINEHEDLEDVRFVLMSSAFEKVDEAQSEEVRFHGSLTKPFDPAHLREVLSQVLAQVMAKRMEPTSILTRPGAAPVPPIPPSMPSEMDFGISVDDPVEGVSPDADIRQLTESTIRMSGLDDYNWNIQEPSLKPPAGLQDSGGSRFNLDGPADLQTPPPLPISMRDVTRDDLKIETHMHVETESPSGTWTLPETLPETFSDLEPVPETFPMTPAAEPAPAPIAAPAQSFSISDEQIEEIVRKKVEESLEKLAHSILPQVAERVIKAEIHRLLNEQP